MAAFIIRARYETTPYTYPLTTQVTAAPGITVSNVNLTSPTTLNVQLDVGPAVPLNPTSIVVTAGAQDADLPNGFTIN